MVALKINLLPRPIHSTISKVPSSPGLYDAVVFPVPYRHSDFICRPVGQVPRSRNIDWCSRAPRRRR